MCYDYPVFLTEPCVRGILEGRKTRMRQLAWERAGPLVPIPSLWQAIGPGTRLWLQEPWSVGQRRTGAVQLRYASDAASRWLPDPDQILPAWTPPAAAAMPRWASRLTLLVTGTRLEALWDIQADPAEAVAEGCACDGDGYLGGEDPETDAPKRFPDAVSAFRDRWDGRHGQVPGRRWKDNPTVVVVGFLTHRCNIDALEQAA